MFFFLFKLYFSLESCLYNIKKQKESMCSRRRFGGEGEEQRLITVSNESIKPVELPVSFCDGNTRGEDKRSRSRQENK
jgi:hypothetical protein